MAAIIGSLRGVLSLDSAAFETGAKRSQATMGNVERRMVRLAGKVEGAGRRMSLGLTAPLVGMAAVALKTSLSVVDSQAKMAQSLGTTVKSLQVLDRAADLSGVSMGEVEQATIQLTKRLSQVESGGAKGAAKALDRLHLSANDLQSLPLDERIGAIQTAMARYVPEAERAAIASELFGSRAGLIFTRIDGSALRVATQDVSRFGLAVSEVDAEQIERTNDAISRLSLAGRGLANQITVSLAPTIEGISDKLALAGEWFAGLNSETKQTIVLSASLAAAIGPLALGLGVVLRIAAPLVGVVKGLGLAVVGLGTAMNAIPIVAFVSLAAATYEGFANSRRAAEEYTGALELTATAQTSLSAATDIFYTNMTTKSAKAMRLAAENARDATRAALEAAKAELEAASFNTNFFGASLWETERMAKARADIVKLNGALAEAESRLDAAGVSAERVENETEGAAKNLADAGTNSQFLSNGLGLAAGQAATLGSFLAGLPGALAGSAANIAGLRAGIASLSAGGSQAAANVAKYRAQLEASLPALNTLHDGQRRQVQEGIDQKVQQYELEQRLTKEFQTRTTAVNKLSAASGGAAKKVENQLTKEIAQRRALLAMTGKERQMYQAVLSVQQRLGSDAAKYSQAQIKALAGQIVALDDTEAAMQRVADQQGRWADNITRLAFDGGSLGDTIQGMLRDVAYQFANSKIVLPVVASVTNILGLGQLAGGAGASIAGGVTGGSNNGLLGGLLGSKASGLLGGGGFLGGIGSGLGGILSGGGLGASASVLGGLATGSVGLSAGAIGAALPVAGIALAVAAGLKKAFSREYFGTALRGSLGSDGFDGTSFDFHKGGAFRSDKHVYKAVPDAIQAGLDTTMKGVTTGLKAMAVTLGLSSSALAGFNDTGFTLWTNGKSQAQIQEELSNHIEAATEKMAALVLNTSDFSQAGETAQETLARLSSGLSAANDMADLLGHRAFAVSLAGADAASHLADMFGSIETMTAATGAYMQAVYSEGERTEITIRRLRATFADLGLVMPESRDGLRAMVEGFDTTTEAGRKSYAEVMKLSGALDGILPKVAKFTLSVSGLLDQIGGKVGSQLETARSMATDAKSAASLWYRTAETLRGFLGGLLNSNLSAANRAQTAAANRGQFDAAFAKARAGDSDAARDIPALAKAYLTSARATSRTDLEFRRIASQVQGQVKFLAGLSDLEGANEDVLRGLYEQQIAILTNLGNFLQLEGLTNEQIGKLDVSIQDLARDFDGTIAGFQTSLGGLENAIREAEDFSYEALKERLNVAVDILPTANIPHYLKELIQRAETGITSTIDFVVRADIPAPDKWLAVNAASEHIKTVRFFADETQMSTAARDLALGAAGEFQKLVRLVGQNDLGNLSKLALGDAGEFVQAIQFVAGEIPNPARDIVLNELDTITRQIDFKLGDTIPDDQQRLALSSAEAFQRVINIVARTVPTQAIQRLAMDDPTRFTRSLNVVAGRVPDAQVQAMALGAASKFTRRLNIEAGNQPSNDIIRLALATGGELRRTMRFLVAGDLDAESRRLALAGNSELTRTINAALSSSADRSALHLALNTVGAYDVAVRAALSGAISNDVRKLVFEQAGTYAVSVEAALSDGVPAGVRKALLREQGDLVVNVFGTLRSGLPAQMQALLLNANTKALRGVTIGAVYGKSLNKADLDLLRKSSTTAKRSITALVNSGRIKASDLVFLDQLTRTAPVKRVIDANMRAFGISGLDKALLAQLGAGKGSVQRVVDANMRAFGISDLDEALLVQLGAGKGGVLRVVDANMRAFGISGLDKALLAQLSAGKGGVQRVVDANMRAFGISDLDRDLLAQLELGKGSVKRVVDANMRAVGISGLDKDLLAQLQKGTGTIDRIIKGKVDLGGLSDQQQAMLQAINGATAGKITLGGSFVFDPSSGFSSWFGSTVQSGIVSPMSDLTDALGDLRQAIADQTAGTARSETIAGLNNYAAGMFKNSSGQHIATEAQVRKLAELAGVNTKGTAQQLAYRVKSLSKSDVLDDIYVDKSGYQTRQLLRSRVGTDGLKVKAGAYLGAYKDVKKAGVGAQKHFDMHGQDEIASGRRSFRPDAFNWKSIGLNVPGFAAGGEHGGGWRVVGERGWELEHTGSSRVVNNSDATRMLDQRQVVDELQKLRRDGIATQDQLKRLAEHARSTDRTLQKLDLNGIKQREGVA
ncbi:hypothetical protein KL867_17755 [Ruegeria litorea]|uniref:Phage tail tape measure protein n=1 Tax=Falsiruegeria litorea TaxID=1280831 RepID=A0ABS5WWM5_9RHOB|nr:hypothetical protein [Falsiruegeria litorea]MBT3142918.1 hypothetical protein [Falsiruegeria litorea]